MLENGDESPPSGAGFVGRFSPIINDVSARDSCSTHGVEVAIGVIIEDIVPSGVGDRLIMGAGVRK